MHRFLGRAGYALVLLGTLAFALSWCGTWVFDDSMGQRHWGIVIGIAGIYTAFACLSSGIGVLLLRRPGAYRLGLAFLLIILGGISTFSEISCLRALEEQDRRVSSTIETLTTQTRVGHLPPAESDVMIGGLRAQVPYDLVPPISWVAMVAAVLDPFSSDGLFLGLTGEPHLPSSRRNWTQSR
ncbi:hypothetical protein [Asaia sp. As-1742]|uniref:hypothetical protein n=1 Tax=Asaia sp. As-1742 TaxID=2608325 RepID=UPI00141D7939|nr:hypothetical protein [Asaia sp. As-1742]NIE81549.1 hypothetical protein [Asaia sp. As-1742]